MDGRARGAQRGNIFLSLSTFYLYFYTFTFFKEPWGKGYDKYLKSNPHFSSCADLIFCSTIKYYKLSSIVSTRTIKKNVARYFLFLFISFFFSEYTPFLKTNKQNKQGSEAFRASEYSAVQELPYERRTHVSVTRLAGRPPHSSKQKKTQTTKTTKQNKYRRKNQSRIDSQWHKRLCRGPTRTCLGVIPVRVCPPGTRANAQKRCIYVLVPLPPPPPALRPFPEQHARFPLHQNIYKNPAIEALALPQLQDYLKKIKIKPEDVTKLDKINFDIVVQRTDVSTSMQYFDRLRNRYKSYPVSSTILARVVVFNKVEKNKT